MPSLPAPVVSPELRVDATRVIHSLKQRLMEEIAKVVVLEIALAESQERESALSAALSRQQEPAQAAAPE